MSYDLEKLVRLGARRAAIDDEIKREVIAAKAAGVSEETIAAAAHVVRGTVRNWVEAARRARERGEDWPPPAGTPRHRKAGRP